MRCRVFLAFFLTLLLAACAPSLHVRKAPPPPPEQERAPGTPKPPVPPEKEKPKTAGGPIIPTASR